MAVRQDTIFERFLAPIFQHFLIDQEAMEQFYRSIGLGKDLRSPQKPPFNLS
jgi:hypothetical protein